MTLRPQFSLIHSEFNEFLFAAVGEEKNGIPLTVLSALTRLGLDPWGEAARLADLPRDAAARALAAVIAALPEGCWTASDSPAIAARLVHSLPQRGVAAVPPAEQESGGVARTKFRLATLLICAVLAAALLIAVWRQQPDQGSAPAPGVGSSQQR